jgi:signal transduction histidine kinase
MSITAYAQQICSFLDELALPRAVVNTQFDRFVAWNPHFLSTLKVREEDIKTVAASGVVYLEGGGVEFGDGLRMIPCSAHPLGERKHPVHGHAILLPGGFNFVMLDVDKSVRQVFHSNLEVAVEQERSRTYRLLHDRLSPRLMAMAFLTESLAGRLEGSQPEAVEEVAKIRRLLGDVLNTMRLLFAPPYSPQNSKGAREEAPGPAGAEP